MAPLHGSQCISNLPLGSIGLGVFGRNVLMYVTQGYQVFDSFAFTILPVDDLCVFPHPGTRHLDFFLHFNVLFINMFSTHKFQIKVVKRVTSLPSRSVSRLLLRMSLFSICDMVLLSF